MDADAATEIIILDDFDVVVTDEVIAVTIDEWIEVYLDKFPKKGTRESYGAIIGKWRDYCGYDEKQAWRDGKVVNGTKTSRVFRATNAHALKFMSELVKKGGIVSNCGRHRDLTPGVFNKYVIILRGFYKFLQNQRAFPLDEVNPFEPIDTRKVPKPYKRPTKAIPKDAIRKLLAAPSAHTKQGICDRAMLAVGFGGALRRAEICALTIEDIDRESGKIILRSDKAGDVNIEQPVIPEFFPAVVELLKQRLAEGAQPKDSLFMKYSAREVPLRGYTKDHVYRVYRDYTVAIGLGKIGPHSMRATTITRGLGSGLDHRQIQDFSRHKSIAMVEKYDKRSSQAEETAKRIQF